MIDEEKTKDQLVREVQSLRRHLIELKTAYGEMSVNQLSIEKEENDASSASADPFDLVWSPDETLQPILNDSPELVESTAQDPSVSGAFAALLTDELHLRSLTETGSFDLRWITMASFGRLIHAIPMPILLVDVSGRIEFANNAFLKFCDGFCSPESFYSLFPEDRTIRTIRNMMHTVLAERKPLLREGLIRIDRTELWSRMNFRSIRFGRERAILVLIEDLTSVRREITLNEKYRTLVDIFPIGIAEFALEKPAPPNVSVNEILPLVLDAKVTEANGTFASLCGLDGTEKLKGMTLDRVLPQSHVQYHKFWIRNNFDVDPFETAEKAEDGGIRYFENTLVANIQEGVLVRFWVMKQDITERKRVEAELIEKIKTIDELYEHIMQSREAKVIAEHTARVAHELRQPLAIIGGFVRRMAKEYGSLGKTDRDSQNETLQIIIKEVLRLEKILGGLIDFTKHEAISLQIVNPNEVVEYVVRINQWKIKEKSLRVELSLGEEIGDLLLDSDKFQEVVRNLLANAVEASPRGERIRVSTGVSIPSEKAHQTGELNSETYFELKIHNEGEPIGPEDLEKIFDPFFTTKNTGMGLGLTVSRKIVEDHSGSVSVTSDETGTLVTVWLPLSQPASEKGALPRLPR
ncbi:MAG: PAS domain-containing protein [Desulfomonile tiedjei]|uniref:histidine kinase n=1 Tax=Desulfomonile tiedjei TaxID=2358 RepID=A0A9D6V3B0_9BACT|nr:PAS domain-containing protein [Desulfomonile tiedjei]